MTNTYNKKPCPPGCIPGIKCDYCRTVNSAIAAPVGEASGAPEKPATGMRFFTAGEAAQCLHPIILEEKFCRKFIIYKLHKGGAHCPDCHLFLDDDTGFREGRRCHCGRCGRWFTATSGTFLEGKHLDYRQTFLLAVLVDLMETGITPARIADILGISADTVRLWIKTFKVLEAHGG